MSGTSAIIFGIAIIIALLILFATTRNKDKDGQ